MLMMVILNGKFLITMLIVAQWLIIIIVIINIMAVPSTTSKGTSFEMKSRVVEPSRSNRDCSILMGFRMIFSKFEILNPHNFDRIHSAVLRNGKFILI